jgi:hypothetical protein
MLGNPTNPSKPEDYGSGGGDVIRWGLGIEESLGRWGRKSFLCQHSLWIDRLLSLAKKARACYGS